MTDTEKGAEMETKDLSSLWKIFHHFKSQIQICHFFLALEITWIQFFYLKRTVILQQKTANYVLTDKQQHTPMASVSELLSFYIHCQEIILRTLSWSVV